MVSHRVAWKIDAENILSSRLRVNYREKSSVSNANLTLISIKLSCWHNLLAFRLATRSNGPRLRASARTSCDLGLYLIFNSKLCLADRSQSCLVQAQRIGSWPFPEKRTCCEAMLSVFIRREKLWGFSGRSEATACTRFRASSCEMLRDSETNCGG